jgi:putative membrane protein
MPVITIIFAGIAGLFHVLFFLMESIFYMNPKVHQAFGVRKKEDAKTLKLTMFNQGFYNLFLATGMFIGIYFLHSEYLIIGKTLVVFCSASMFAASLILFISKPAMLRGVILQGLCPLIALVSWWVI